MPPSLHVGPSSARYVKIVEGSHEDRCYVGSSPGLIYGGRHGDDEKAVFDELCRIVEDAIERSHDLPRGADVLAAPLAQRLLALLGRL
jgi:hypothetical protein